MDREDVQIFYMFRSLDGEDVEEVQNFPFMMGSEIIFKYNLFDMGYMSSRLIVDLQIRRS